MKRFKTKLGICALGSLFMAMPCFARQLSLDEALRNASGNPLAGHSRSMHELLYTEQADGLNVAYILSANEGEGYVVLAADDVLPAVLGYSDTGRFDAASIPPAMEAWMQEYGRQLTYAVANGIQTVEAAEADHPSVAPLCPSTWGQSTPYNNNCPEAGKKRSPTGCVATAMAQVMYAHKWPETGTGENSYISGTFHQNMSFNFGATTFDWANMLPSYSAGRYTEQQGAAVATLMEACGNAAQMNYGESASGAYPYNAIYGMVNFMKYDKGAMVVLRDYYPSTAWDALIYNELAEGRPVIYGGYTADYQSGHSFVVDGYSKDGYYHLNWGWSGMSNGYFLLTGLDPSEQGIGGSASGYNYRQDAVIGIMPAKEGSKNRVAIFWDGAFATVAANYPKNGAIQFVVTSADAEKVYDVSTLEDVEITMGVNLTPVDGGETTFYAGSTINIGQHYGLSQWPAYSSYYVMVSTLPSSGEYIATPAFRYNDEVNEVNVRVGEVKELKIALAKVGVSIEPVKVERTLTATDIKAETPLYAGKSCTITTQITNTGEEYLGMVRAGLANEEGTVLCWLDNVPVNVPDGKTVTANISGKLVRMTDGQPLATGDYTVRIYDADDIAISEPVSVTITDAPTDKLSYDMSYKVSGALSGDGSSINPFIVEDQIYLDLTFNVYSGLFDEDITLYAYYDSDYSDATFSGENSTSKIYFIGKGMSQTQVYTVGTANFEPGKTVYIQPYAWSNIMNWLPLRIYVKHVNTGINEIAADNSGIYPNPAVSTTTVTAKADITGIDVYSVTGARMMSAGDCGATSAELNVAALPAGHYIVVVKTVNGTETHRLIKK